MIMSWFAYGWHKSTHFNLDIDVLILILRKANNPIVWEVDYFMSYIQILSC